MTFTEGSMWLGAFFGVLGNFLSARTYGMGIFIALPAVIAGICLGGVIEAVQRRVSRRRKVHGGLKCHGCGRSTGIKIETVWEADHLSCPHCWLTLKERNGPVK